MAGFNFEEGRSHNMCAAEARGMVTIGRWAKRHKVSARAACEVMQPTEAHHTGTGRHGKSRLTPVISAATEPTADQLAAMQAWDRCERPTVRGWYTKWDRRYYGPYGRKRNVPTVGLFCGDAADDPGITQIVDDAEWAEAQAFAGRDLIGYATDFRQVRE
jgi:hypothetical protein